MAKKINITCFISLALLGIYISVYQNIIGMLSKEHAINNTVAGAIISLHFLGSLASPIIFGEVSDRTGKKPVVIIAFCILTAGLLEIFLFKGIAAVSIGIFLIGCAFSVIEGTLSGVLVEVNPMQSGSMTNFSQMFFSIGAVLGPLLSNYTVKLTGNWKTLFFFMAIIFACIAVFMSRLQFGKSMSGIESEKGLISYKLLKEKNFIRLCIAIFAYVGIEEGVAFWLGTYYENIDITGSIGAFTLSGYWGGMIIGRYLAGKLYAANKLFLKEGLVVSLLFITFALISGRSVTSSICFILTGLGFSVIWPAIMSIAAESYPRYSGTALGVMMTFGAGGGAAVPLFMGSLSSLTGIQAAFCLIPAVILILLKLQLKIGRQNYSRT